MATILIVDDDAALVESTKDLLTHSGHSVIDACNGTDGMAMARANKPDLMILDVMMTHDHEGFDVARTLHDDPATRDIPIILVTGISKTKGLPFSYEPDPDWLPVKGVLNKPVRPDVLLAVVETALKR